MAFAFAKLTLGMSIYIVTERNVVGAPFAGTTGHKY